MITIKPGTGRQNYLRLMHWLKIDTAPFDRDIEVAVIDFDGPHPVIFPCRRILGGWVKAMTQSRVEIHPTHWREWDTKLPLACAHS